MIEPGKVYDFEWGGARLHGIAEEVHDDTVVMRSTTGPVTITVPVADVGQESGLDWFAVAAQVAEERRAAR